MSRLRACAISTSAGFGLVGTASLGGGHPLTCPVIFCIAFWRTGCRPNTSVTWIVRVSGYLIALGLRESRASRRGSEPVHREPEAGHHAGTPMEWSGATGHRAGRRLRLERHNLSQPIEADRRHHRPAGHHRPPDSNRRWITVGGTTPLHSSPRHRSSLQFFRSAQREIAPRSPTPRQPRAS